MTISVYVNYFAPAKILKTEVLIPLQVGATKSDYDLGILRDDSGDNISELNSTYCEMTGVYWAWKNDVKSDVLGFMHYRRYLDFFPKTERQINPHGMVDHPALDKELIGKFGLDEANIEHEMEGFDMIVPQPFDVRQAGSSTVRKHYGAAPHHHSDDLDLAVQIVGELSPEYSPHFEKVLSGYKLYPNNMFLFTRPFFNSFCEWIFPILKRLDAEIDVSGYNWQEARAVGFLAERLFAVFVEAQKSFNPDLKIKELHRVLVHQTHPDPKEPELPQTELPIVTVVVSSDASYVPHLGALVNSLVLNTNPDVFLDLIILDGGLSEGTQRLILKLLKFRQSASVSFVDMRYAYLDINVHSYFSRATFFRLGLPELLQNRKRTLFLDTDMIVMEDIRELHDLDLEGCLIAAVPDLVIRAFYSMKVGSIASTGSLPMDRYVGEYLGMNINGSPAVDKYFQAGTIVMDLDGLRQSKLFDEAIEDLKENTYWFLDQDILNKYLFGKVKFINTRWNTLWMDERHGSALSPEDLLTYTKSLEQPAIAHYAGVGKPWMNSFNPLGHYYWEYLRGTPWYEAVLFKFLDARFQNIQNEPQNRRYVRRSFHYIGATVWKYTPAFIKPKIWPLADRIKRKIS